MSGRIIGIGGYAGAGKDAVADILENKHGFYRTFMSAPVHEMLCVLDPEIEVRHGVVFRYSELIRQLGYARAKELPEVRRLLQVLGTEVGRDMIDPDIWVLQMHEKLSSYKPDDNIVVTGIRFQNEADMIRRLQGELWWVMRPGYGPVNAHPSDNSLTKQVFDMIVFNDADLPYLKKHVTALLSLNKQ